MLGKIVSALLILVGLINIAPIMVFFSPSQTKRLYGIELEGENLSILMRHRGVLLAIVGMALIYGAFKPELRLFVIALALISKIAFIFLTFSASDYSPEIKKVALIDVGSMVLLGIVLLMHFYQK